MNPQVSIAMKWTILILSLVSLTAAADAAAEWAWGTNSWRASLHHGLGNSAGFSSRTFVPSVKNSVQYLEERKLSDGNGGRCPVDLSDLSDVQFAITDTCSKSSPSASSLNNTWPPETTQVQDTCCNIVRTSYAILQAQWTEESHFFRVENESVLRLCISEFVQRIADFGTGLQVAMCFSDSFYKYSNRDPSLCGPKTVEEYEAMIPTSTVDSVRSACSGDLLESTACGLCAPQTKEMYTQILTATLGENVTLNQPDGNVTNLESARAYDCIYDTVTFISAVLIEKGPADPGTQLCVYVMPLPPSSDDSTSVGLIVGLTIASVTVLLLAVCWACVCIRKKKGLPVWQLLRNGSRSSRRSRTGISGILSEASWRMVLFDYGEMKSATDDFSEANHIGTGGFGSVYKGVLSDGTVVAVKRLKNCSTEGEAEFVNEVKVINRARHRNLVKLRGCCVAVGNSEEGHQRLLVYDFLPGGSLNDHLFGKSDKSGNLTWSQRRRIAVDIARGLAYLHNDTTPPIFHRDIKASNVLLDNDYNACVADFGTARLTLEGQSHMTASTVAGTHGYMAPEYAMYGKLTGKSDVYSFGVLLLEILSGRKALDSSQVATPRFLISDWAWTVLESEGSVTSVIDERIRENTNPQELRVQECFVITGMLCSHPHDEMRPTMVEALRYLDGDIPVPRLPSTPAPLYAESASFKTYLEDSTTFTGSSDTATEFYSAVLSVAAEPR